MVQGTQEVKSSGGIKWSEDHGLPGCSDIFIREAGRSRLVLKHRLPIDPAAHREVVVIGPAIDDGQMFSFSQGDRRRAETANFKGHRARTERVDRSIRLGEHANHDRAAPEANSPGQNRLKPGEVLPSSEKVGMDDRGDPP